MISYLELLRLVMPEVILVLAALCVLSVDLMFLRGSDKHLRGSVGAALSLAGCALAVAWILRAPAANVLDGMLVLTQLIERVQIALVILTMLTVLLFVGSKFTEHVGEYLALILLATVSMMFLVSTQNLLLIFLSLELLSLSLYLLTAFDKHSARSAEAALKYFLFGGISAAFLLFGFSLLYGLSNSTNLASIAGSDSRPITRSAADCRLGDVDGGALDLKWRPSHFISGRRTFIKAHLLPAQR